MGHAGGYYSRAFGGYRVYNIREIGILLQGILVDRGLGEPRLAALKQWRKDQSPYVQLTGG